MSETDPREQVRTMVVQLLDVYGYLQSEQKRITEEYNRVYATILNSRLNDTEKETLRLLGDNCTAAQETLTLRITQCEQQIRNGVGLLGEPVVGRLFQASVETRIIQSCLITPLPEKKSGA